MGVEEELLLVDPETRAVAPRSEQVLEAAEGHPHADLLDHELFRHQIETRTQPVTDLGELREQLVVQRKAAAEAAAELGLVTMASGTSPLPGGDPQVTQDDRYLDMMKRYGEIVRPAGTCGMHVHVHVTSDEEGVRVIDGLTPWLPLLLAISTNSPYFHGRDTGHASWRARLWGHWPSAGPTERFGSLQRYRELSAWLIASGAARDEGMLYFDARLSRANPTVEVRVSDVCADPDDAMLIAALVRALAAQALAPDGLGVTASWRSEMLRAAQWRAARYGLSGHLIDPATAEPVPARGALERLIATVRGPLEETGDLDLVTAAVPRVLSATGASRQRAAYERSGGDLRAVVDDLVARTNA